MVYSRHLISKSSSPCTNPLVTVLILFCIWQGFHTNSNKWFLLELEWLQVFSDLRKLPFVSKLILAVLWSGWETDALSTALPRHLRSGWSWFFLWFPVLLVSFPSSWILFQVLKVLLVSRSPLFSITFSAFLHRLRICSVFRFRCSLREEKNQFTGKVP